MDGSDGAFNSIHITLHTSHYSEDFWSEKAQDVMPPKRKSLVPDTPKDDSLAAAKLRALEYSRKAFKTSSSPSDAATARASTPTSRRSIGGGAKATKGKKRTVDEVDTDVSCPSCSQ